MSRRLRHTVAAAALFAIASPAAGTRVLAHERVFHLLDQRDGLPAGEVVRLAQDSRGFVWMGSFAGLVRYDGDRIQAWAPERLSGHVSVLATGPHGDVVVRVEPGRAGDVDPTTLYRIVEGGVEPVAGPDGSPLRGASDAAFGTTGQFCAALETTVVCRLGGGRWIQHVFDGQEQQRPRSIHRGHDDALLAVTDAGIWVLEGTGGRRRLVTLPDVVNVVPAPDGSVYATTFRVGGEARVVKIDAGSTSTMLTLPARPIDMVTRGRVLWVSFDRFVAAVRPGEPPEIIGPESGLPSGGPLLVDHEHNLWLGTYSGVMLLPEPETVVWTELDGLPSRHTRFLEVVGDTMWVGSWQGLGRLRFLGGHWEAQPGLAAGADGMCLDGHGRLWIANSGVGLVSHDASRSHQGAAGRVVYPNPRILSWLGCSLRPDGTLWLSTSEGLFVTSPAGPRRIGPNPPDPDGSVFFRRVAEDRAGRLWVAANEQICQADAAAVARAAPDWRCSRIPESRGISAIVELADGDLWLSTDRVGVWRNDGGGGDWRQIPGSSSLPSYSIRGLVLSADATVWILGHGTVVRVRDDPDSADGWTIVERLSGLQGLPSAAAERVVELPNGSLWITTIVGLVHVPAAARQRPLQAPAVELVDVVINGHRQEAAASWRLASADTVELRFAVLSFRDRGHLRHEYRLRADGEWLSAPTGSGVFRFPDLAAGPYAVEVRASLDGQTWTARPAVVRFEVLPPWYRRTWALGAFVLTMAVGLYAAHRLRLAFLLRLERQRARISMDLHDEIGSGLGSINILASLAAERTPPGSPAARLMSQISDTATEVGSSLAEIVWSLRSRSGTLDALVAHLTERAVKLFPADAPAFSAAIPETLPVVTLSLSVRRNVALVALEALHNAARHAGASKVVLGLEPEGRRWRLSVEDDGRGLRPDEVRSGVGLESMRRRAEEIGGDLTVAPAASGGLHVSLVFDPRAGLP
jgi:signal transduction histidine kinase